MSRVTLSTLFVLAASVFVAAQVDDPTQTFPATPLASKHFSYPTGVPYQADQDNLLRGKQEGYNLCNSTTEGPNSLCQTIFLNSLDDFCLWAPPKPNSAIADTEGIEVAFCTKPGRGTRLIPAGALKSVQFMRTPDYVQVVGTIDQTLINMMANDTGGELDPHGADMRGNPLGSLAYSTAWSKDNNTYEQVMEWHNFMGGDAFCFKACDPAGANAAHYCEHVFDRIGCAYNAPSNAPSGVFESCLGDSQDYPGVYTTNGQVVTYTQPPESLGAISTMPYQPKVPASSSCSTYQSAQLYASLSSAPSATPTTGNGSKPTDVSGSSKPNGTTGTGTAAGAANTSGAMALTISGFSLAGVVLSAIFLS